MFDTKACLNFVCEATNEDVAKFSRIYAGLSIEQAIENLIYLNFNLHHKVGILDLSVGIAQHRLIWDSQLTDLGYDSYTKIENYVALLQSGANFYPVFSHHPNIGYEYTSPNQDVVQLLPTPGGMYEVRIYLANPTDEYSYLDFWRRQKPRPLLTTMFEIDGSVPNCASELLAIATKRGYPCNITAKFKNNRLCLAGSIPLIALSELMHYHSGKHTSYYPFVIIKATCQDTKSRMYLSDYDKNSCAYILTHELGWVRLDSATTSTPILLERPPLTEGIESAI